MKKKQHKVFVLAFGLLVLLTYACKKSFLDIQPLGSLALSNVSNKAGVQTLLIGAYALLDGETGLDNVGNDYGSAGSNWVYGSICADDSYKGSVPGDQPPAVLLQSWSVSTSTSAYLNQKWIKLYNGIQRANEVLRVLPNANDMADADKKITEAEAKFLRGFYHADGKKMWNNIPYVDEKVTYVNKNLNTPNIDATGNFIDIWPSIEKDLKFAVDNLPSVQAQIGRVNKYAAMAFLAKAYMFQHKYAAAKPLLADIINNGVTAGGLKYALVNFESNFNAASKNGAESVFACQFSVNDGSALNGNYGDVLNFPNGAGAPGGCCGFNNPSWNLANAYKTNAVTGLPLLDTWNDGAVVSDDVNTPYSGTLDPRIDWTMGRPGIPYLDYGLDSKSWIRDPNTNGVFSPKKNVYAKSQFGSLSSNETSFWGATQINANNFNFIRFADVLLWAAECEIEIGSLVVAEGYINQVRARAASPIGWVYANATYSTSTSTYSPQTTPADNYKIGLYPVGTLSANGQAYARKAVRFERRLELAMEGNRFFDLQRWDSDNNAGYMATVLNAYQNVEKTRKSFYTTNQNAQFHKGINEYYAIPQAQIDIQNSKGTVTLKQNPGYN